MRKKSIRGGGERERERERGRRQRGGDNELLSRRVSLSECGKSTDSPFVMSYPSVPATLMKEKEREREREHERERKSGEHFG
jgi:hypothetical protein